MEVNQLFDPIQISKIFITGPLSPKMPYIVLSELALECSTIVTLIELKDPIVYGKTFKKIAKYTPPFIDNLYDPNHIQKIINFVNPLVRWNIEKLSHALIFLNYFRNSYKENKYLPKFDFNTVGLQTVENEYSINACVLYGMGVYKGIKNIPLDVTYEQLKDLILYSQDVEMGEPSPGELLNAGEPSPVELVKPRDDSEQDECKEKESKQEKTDEVDKTKDEVETIVGEPELSSISTDDFVDENVLPDGSDLYFSDEEDLKIKDKSKSSNLQTNNWNSDEKSNSSEHFDYFKNLQTIKDISDLYDDINYVRSYFQPMNHYQAIVCGAYTHNKDFSIYKLPLIEFHRFQNDIQSHDTNIRAIEKKNKFYTDLLMYFNPYLPFKLYKSQTLDNHLRLFSFYSYEFVGLNPYEILQELYLEENFYLGWHPNIINDETPVLLESVDNILSEKIVCFGTRQDLMKATTWTELHELFKNTNLFLNPFEKNKLFSNHQIERLLKLGKWCLDCPFEYKYLFIYNEDSKQEIRKCVELISNILLMQKEEFVKLREWKDLFDNMNGKNKNLIKKAFRKLFELTMKMRGWKNDDPYPITSAPSSSNDEIEKRTLDAIIELDECNEECNYFIYSLPLIIWKNEFVQSYVTEQGLTLGDRIKIVKGGESEGVSSCIRISSNVLGSTYCFYCKLFGLKEEFEIENLVYIQ